MKENINNINYLVNRKEEIIKLNESIKKLNEKKKKLDNIRMDCNDIVLVKVSEFNGDDYEDKYYCLLCEKNIDNDIDITKKNIVDFSNFNYDKGLLNTEDKIDIAFELYKNLKINKPNNSDNEIVYIINQMIDEVDGLVKEKVARKSLERIGWGLKKRIV